MKRTLHAFENIKYISDTDAAYANTDERLKEFMAHPPTLDGLRKAIELRKYFDCDRELLTSVLKDQYKSRRQLSEYVHDLIELLGNENSFTITTAHQPCLFGGPLYFVYKILSAIKLAQLCRDNFDDYHFIPIFIIGGEDHDLDEMDHLYLFGNEVKWYTDQIGSVGRMSTERIEEALEKVSDILGDSELAQRMSQSLRDSFLESGLNYGDSMAHWISRLFNGYELVVLSTDDPALKRAFIPHMNKEIFHQGSKPIIERTQDKLEAKGFKSQAFARDINFFYINENGRNRIEKVGDEYHIVDTGLSFSPGALERELHDNPERFSPNVVMRPLYQEFTLPNIAYVGGGGEIAYWLERKSQFAHFGIPFPVLIRRDSVLWINSGGYKQLKKLELSVVDLFEDIEDLKKEYVKEHTDVELDLSRERETIESVYESLGKRAGNIEEGLKKWVLAEGTRQLKALDHVEKRLMRAEKQQHEVSIKRLEKVKDKFFPNNRLQERHDNFMQHYLQFGDWYFQELLQHMDPLEMSFKIIHPGE